MAALLAAEGKIRTERLALWNSPLATLLVELAMFAMSIVL